MNSDLGAVASCSDLSDVLLHSVIRGRLLRKLHGVKADIVRLSKHGVIVTWNNSLRVLSSFTLNGILIAQSRLPLSCSVHCMEISFDGRSGLIGINSCSENVESNEGSKIERLDVPSPSVCFIDLHTLKVKIENVVD